MRNEEPKHHKPEKNSQIADVREKIKTGVKTAQDASETAMNVSHVHEDPEGSKEYDDQVRTSTDMKYHLFSMIWLVTS